MTEREYKILHNELWDFIVKQLRLIKEFGWPIPDIIYVKEFYFYFSEKKEKPVPFVKNLCFACAFADEKSHVRCSACPLSVKVCWDETSPYAVLEGLEGTFNYDKAIKLAEEIRDSWRNIHER